jgi:glutamate racemase
MDGGDRLANNIFIERIERRQLTIVLLIACNTAPVTAYTSAEHGYVKLDVQVYVLVITVK